MVTSSAEYTYVEYDDDLAPDVVMYQGDGGVGVPSYFPDPSVLRVSSIAGEDAVTTNDNG